MTLEEEIPIMNETRSRSNMVPEKQNYLISILCVLFGMGAWILINSIYTQMPILVQNAPEGWSLPSYFSLLVQFANIAPLLYALFKNQKYFFKDSTLISFFLLLGTISMIILALNYDENFVIFGHQHSVYLLSLSFLISLVSCVSSVLFLPFMNTLPEIYLVPYFIGEGLSGFIPSIISLIQGVQKNPKCETPLFNSKFFFLIISCLMGLSFCSFTYLHLNPNFKNVKIKLLKSKEAPSVTSLPDSDEKSEEIISKSLYGLLLIIQMILNGFSNGILPSIQSFSCLPYGTSTYHLALNLSQIASPLTSYLSFFVPVTSLRLLAIGFFIFFICLIYELMTAFLSPAPPQPNITIYSIIVVIIWVLGTAAISFTKLSIATIFRRKDTKALFHYGIVTQFGSAIGSVLSFYLVNYSGLLHTAVYNEKC